MTESLQEAIRRRAAERDKEGLFANPSLEDLHDAGSRTPMSKRRKAGRTPLVKAVTEGATEAASAARAGGGRWFSEALKEGGRAPSPPPSPLRKEAAAADASPTVQMLDDMQRVLEVFRSEEGRDPTTDDKEFWRAYTKIIANRIGGSE